jgi:superfamily I DNA/RNA helicase
MESRIKEKNQLRYVAFTRARKNLYVLCESTTYI